MINGLYGGGAENILQTILQQLDQTKYDITLYGVINENFDSNIYPSYIKYKSVFNGIIDQSKNHFIIKLKNKIKLLIYNNLPASIFYKLFIRGTYDVEVAFIEGYSTKIISGSNQNSLKITWVHIDLEANHWTEICYKNIKDEVHAYKKYDHIVSVSNSVKEAFSKKFKILNHLSVKYNPVNQDDILKKSSEELKIAALNSKIRLITVGRLEPQKGYDRLIRVAGKLKNEGFDFELWIIGKGNQQQKLENLITEHKLENVVTLKGFQTNPYKFIMASDLFVCSSRSEGFSTVVTEALILGKPVVATNCSGMTELLGDSEYGLVTENNEDALYLGIKTLISDNTLLNHYQKKSQERSRDFDIKKTMHEVEKLWL